MSPRLPHRSRERPARLGCFVSRRSEERLRQYPLFACPSCHGVVLIVAFITQACVIDQFRAHHRTRAARAPPESNSHPDVASVDVADVGVVQHAGAIRVGGHELHFAGTKGEFHRRPRRWRTRCTHAAILHAPTERHAVPRHPLELAFRYDGPIRAAASGCGTKDLPRVARGGVGHHDPPRLCRSGGANAQPSPFVRHAQEGQP